MSEINEHKINFPAGLRCRVGAALDSALLRYGWTERCSALIRIFWICAAFSVFLAFSPDFPEYQEHSSESIGSYLFYGFKCALSFCMPLTDTVNVLMERCSLETQFLLHMGGYLCLLSLVYALSALMHSRKAGVLAVLLACIYFAGFDMYGDLEQRLLAITVLGFAFYGALDEMRPSMFAKIAAGVMLGCGFLVRSTMALFPFFWVGYRLLTAPEGGRRACLKGMLPTLYIPYLMLLPWIVYVRLVTGDWVLFERGRAAANIIAGAVGMVGTAEMNYSVIARLRGFHTGDSVLFWALRQVCSHPAVYMQAVADRTGEVFLLHPVLLVCAFAGALLCRKNPAARILALLAGYLLVMHCLMAIEPRYFIPLWLVCVPLAAVFSVGWMASGPQVLSGLAAVPCAVVFACALFTMALLAAYPVRAARDDGDIVSQALGSRDYWLWKRCVFKGIYDGDMRMAAEAAGKTIILKPALTDGSIEMRDIYRLVLSARHDTLVARAVRGLDFRLAEMLESSSRGDYDGCRRYYRKYMSGDTVIFRHFNAHEKALYGEWLASGVVDLPQLHLEKYKDVAARMERQLSPCISISGAEPLLLGRDFEEVSGIYLAAMKLQEGGYPRLSEVLLGLLVRAHPQDAKMRSDLGVSKVLCGDIAGAEKDFHLALQLDPDFGPAKESLAWVAAHKTKDP